jgi:DNA anti-recombination protein RmuC
MKESIETLQEENQQLTTEIHEVKAILEVAPTATPFELESDGSN